MNLTTTCPQCKTRFRVTQEQLDARGGRVRCGRCAHVFDARATLGADPSVADVSEQIEIVAPPSPPMREPEPEPAPEPIQPPTPLPEQMDEVPGIGDTTEGEESEDEETPPGRRPRVVRVQPTAPAAESTVSPENPKYAPPARPRRAWPWVLANVLLLFGLSGQAVYTYRDVIAANYPPTRPLLEQACAALGCRVDLLRKPDLIGIETSELHADPARANIVVLASVLHSRAPHVLAYPSLELTLTNSQDEVVGRRVFSPKEYLPKTELVGQGIPARGDVSVKLLMDLGNLKADGYRLYLFYPG